MTASDITHRPLALYVHLPWCIRKCPYCDFNSHAVPGTDEPPWHDYLDALLRELDRDADTLARRGVDSVFFGGGTPSLTPPPIIDRFLRAVAALAPLTAATEITLEANPGAVDQSHLASYRAAGVNRLSIGVQSFDDRMLTRLGRIHAARHAHAAIEAATAAGFERVNVDLMHGLPGQAAADAETDLRTAIESGVEHVSWYQLTIEPNTAFHRRPPDLPDEDTLHAIETAGFRRLADAGFRRYEVSAWTRLDACRHNLAYWTFGDYLGLGAGAHGKCSDRDTGALRVRRFRNHRHPEAYMRSVEPRVETRTLMREDLIAEFMMNALRLTDGAPRARFEAATGLSADAIDEIVNRLVSRGLMAAGSSLRTTPLGLQFLDAVVAEFA